MQIVSQLDILTRTVGLLERRLGLLEDRPPTGVQEPST
jgi:hypothetical protein